MIVPETYLTRAYTERFDDLLSYLERWYGWVDRRALAAVLSAILNHYWLEDPPIWLLLQCPPEYALRPFLTYQDAIHHYGFATSTFPRDMLRQSVPHAIWLFPEFEHIYSCRPRIQKALTKTLTSVQHGEAVIAEGETWSGKITVLAAHSVAPNPADLRRSARWWAPLAGAFLVVRWKHPREEQQLDFARRRVGFEKQIEDGMRARVLSLLDLNFRRPQHADIAHEDLDELSKLAALASRCYDRRRNPHFRRTLWTQSLARLCRAHATLMGKLRTDVEEAYLAKRLAQDSLPPTVLKLLKGFPPGAYCTPKELEQLTDIPRNALKFLLNSLLESHILDHRTLSFHARTGHILRKSEALCISSDVDALVRGDL